MTPPPRARPLFSSSFFLLPSSLSGTALARICRSLGDPLRLAFAVELEARAGGLVAVLNKEMWNEEAGIYVNKLWRTNAWYVLANIRLCLLLSTSCVLLCTVYTAIYCCILWASNPLLLGAGF